MSQKTIVEKLAEYGVNLEEHLKCMKTCIEQTSCSGCPCRSSCIMRKCFYADPHDESDFLGVSHAFMIKDAERQNNEGTGNCHWLEKKEEELKKYPTYSEE